MKRDPYFDYSPPPRWFARSEPINWFDVIRDACALAFLLVIAFAFLWWLA